MSYSQRTSLTLLPVQGPSSLLFTEDLPGGSFQQVLVLQDVGSSCYPFPTELVKPLLLRPLCQSLA